MKTDHGWKPCVLIVEDTPDWIEIFSEKLIRSNWRVKAVDNVPEALRLIRSGDHNFNAAIVDKGGSGRWSGELDKIGHRDGLRVLRELKQYFPECVRILATGESWSPDLFSDDTLGLNIFYDKASARATELVELLNNWKVPSDGRPYLLLNEGRGRRERWH